MNGVASRLRPEPPTRGRTPAAVPDDELVALLPIGADLLPRQTAGAGGGRSRRLVAVGLVLVAVVAVTGGWALARHAGSGATAQLDATQARTQALQAQESTFDELVGAQNQSNALRAELATLMATDTSWSTVLGDLARVRGAVTFTSVQAGVDDPTATGGTSGTVADGVTPGAVGHVAVSGTAPDKPAVAAFVEALGGVTGFADPFLSTVTALSDAAGAGGYSFTVTVALTGDLRTAAPSRWATTSGGGK